MARIRTIKPEFWQDEDLAEVSEPTLILAAGLLNHSDDEGYFKANPGLIKAAVFPLREPSVSIQDMLNELSKIGYLTLFFGKDNKQYGHITKFTTHQKINRPTKSKIKDLADITENSVSPPEQLTGGKERKGTGKGSGKGVKKFTPPTITEVKTYCTSRSNNVDPQKFVDFYQAKDWMIGKNKMKDWQAAVRTWEKTESEGYNGKNDLEYGAGAI